MTMSTLDNVSVAKTANIYFDGKCVSHTVHAADGSRKSVGVIFPHKLTFNTGGPERMEITAGVCRVKMPGTGDWQVYRAGDSFNVPANASFDIEPLETLHYVCHFG